MPEINFFSEDTDFNFQEIEKAIKWLQLIGSNHSKEIGVLNIIFCSDEYLHKLNIEYLQHDTLTDIITFPHEDGDFISGDIFISIDRVKDNASEYGVQVDTELIRVMAHGLLHLCGLMDKTDEDKNVMRQQEERAIKLWNEIN